ncbi:MAG: lipopolysaccharide heptosyltransferase II [Bacillota bacterium]
MSAIEEKIKQAQKILVIDLLYLGDLLFATPFIRNLRASFPEARIEMVVNSNFIDIIDNNPHLDRVIPYDKRFTVLESIRFARELKSNEYDLGINIHGNWRTALLLRLISPDISAGFGTRGRGFFLDKALTPAEDRHMVQVYLEVLDDLGLALKAGDYPEIVVEDRARTRVNNLLQAKGIDPEDSLIALNTGGSWPTKRWPEASFARLADRLISERGIKVIFPGGNGDKDRITRIFELMKEQAVDLSGETTLRELAALFENCRLVISGDSGPAHVAAATGTPVICLFGPSDEEKFRPYASQVEVVSNDLPCRPCGEHECPRDHHLCLEGIGVQDILQVMRRSDRIDTRR